MFNQTVIGLDIGRSAVKVVAWANGIYYRDVFPSVVCPAVTIADEVTARAAARDTVTVQGRNYFVGDTARLQGSAESTVGLSNDWTNSPEYLALVAGAIKHLEVQEAPGLENPYIVIGTPSSMFESQREDLIATTSQVINAEMKTLPQPMGAYLSFYLDPRGLPVREAARDEQGRARSWAVIDVGHFTSDFLLMREGHFIQSGLDSCTGIYLAAQSLNRVLNAKNISASLIACEQALRSKSIFHFGAQRPIEAEVEAATNEVVQAIVAKANALLAKDVSSLDGVIIAGGGGPVIFDAIAAKWPHARLLEDPRMSIATGFCRYGIGIQTKRRATADAKTKAAAATA